MLDLRIFRSFHAKYYEDDILGRADRLSGRLLRAVLWAAWPPGRGVAMRGILRDLAPTDCIPDAGLGDRPPPGRAGRAVERAKRHGVQVLLYLNEPLCLPRDHPFWAAASGSARRASGDSLHGPMARDATPSALPPPQVRPGCARRRTPVPDVPDLGGWFLITASEHHTHCYSHIWRCAGRTGRTARAARRATPLTWWPT